MVVTEPRGIEEDRRNYAEAEAAGKLARELDLYIERAVGLSGSSSAVRPDHRIKFSWPPHPISYKYHVLATDWTGKAKFSAFGEEFSVAVARTPHGIFGRCEALWLEAKGEDVEDMLERMAMAAEPYFDRMFAINRALELPGRFIGTISSLGPIELLKLLYARDRDVANDARGEIEKQASNRLFTPSLIEVLNDERHPMRRSAQWCVLDLFEDLQSYARDEAEERQAVAAMRNLIWNATDDYARTIYKAGVVLGGHLPDTYGGPVLIECLNAPSKIGRRSAIHGLFHVVEWVPERREEIVDTLRSHAAREQDLLLAAFASQMADDIAEQDGDHVPEPVFPDEPG